MSMAQNEKDRNIEWIGGIISMPAYVTRGGDTYRPDVLVWMSAEGLLLGSLVGKPGELFDKACDSLHRAIEKPIDGHAHTPSCVRVASPELADVLRAGHPSIEVVCAPTPEIDAMVSVLRQVVDSGGDTNPSYLAPGLEPDAVASFFQAMAGLFRLRPWTFVPADEYHVAVTIETLGLPDAVLSIIGQMGQNQGFLLFSGMDTLEAFLEAGDVFESGEEPQIPSFISLCFESRADIGPELREEIAEHGWEIAGKDANPWLAVTDTDGVQRSGTATEMIGAEAIARALTEVLGDAKESKQWIDAWNGGEPVSRTVLVSTYKGDIEVTLRTLRNEETAKYRPPYDVLAGLRELDRSEDEIDPELRDVLEEELMRRFVSSPEYQGLSGVQFCHAIMDYAASYFGVTIATLGPVELGELVFEIIPRKGSVEASSARSIIEQNRAFYAFLKREFGLEQADRCLGVLGDRAIKQLAAALSNPRNFGLAKSLFMAGRRAGFDMDTEEGFDAWAGVLQTKPLSLAPLLPPRPTDRPPSRRARTKNKRKTSRKAQRHHR